MLVTPNLTVWLVLHMYIIGGAWKIQKVNVNQLRQCVYSRKGQQARFMWLGAKYGGMRKP